MQNAALCNIRGYSKLLAALTCTEDTTQRHKSNENPMYLCVNAYAPSEQFSASFSVRRCYRSKNPNGEQ